MNKIKLASLAASAALAAFSVACDTAPTATTNTAVSNTAVVVNNNGNANTATVATTNANTRRVYNYNANMTRADYDRERDRYAAEAKETGGKIGQGAEDGWLWTKTRASLLTTDDLRESTINVDVDNAVVTLRGTVANAAQKAKAIAEAKKIDGVKSVKDELKVNPNDSATNLNGNVNSNVSNANRRN